VILLEFQVWGTIVLKQSMLPSLVRDTLKKSSFPRRLESRFLILLGFVFGKNGLSE